MKKLSLKFKITLWYTAFLLLLAVMMLGFMLAIAGQVVEQDVKKRLERLVEENVTELDWEDGALETDDDFIPYREGISIFVFDDSKTMLLGSDRFAQSPAALPFAGGSVRVDGTYYVYDRQVELEHYGSVWLRGICAADGSGRANVVDTVVKLAFLTFPMLVLLAAGGGYLIAKRSLRPVEQIRIAAAKIGAGSDLSRRIGLETGGDELHRLAGTFDGMLDRLERSFVAEQQFTSDASHELRTPMAVILAQCEYALEAPRESGDYVEALEVVRRQGEKISRLITQLLAFTRLEQGTQAICVEQIDLSTLVSALCVEQAEFAPNGIRLESNIASELYVQADVVLMTRLVTNLIANAFQYGRQGGHTRVSLTRCEDEIHLTVEDDGIGISPEELPKIWRRFYQANPARSDAGTGSMGLGLAMAEQIARLHGGRMTVESVLGAGSSFTLILLAKNN